MTPTSTQKNADGTTLIRGAEDKTIKLWQVSDGQLLKTLSGHSEIVTCKLEPSFAPSLGNPERLLWWRSARLEKVW
jgi:WD40 repeat protein